MNNNNHSNKKKNINNNNDNNNITYIYIYIDVYVVVRGGRIPPNVQRNLGVPPRPTGGRRQSNLGTAVTLGLRVQVIKAGGFFTPNMCPLKQKPYLKRPPTHIRFRAYGLGSICVRLRDVTSEKLLAASKSVVQKMG